MEAAPTYFGLQRNHHQGATASVLKYSRYNFKKYIFSNPTSIINWFGLSSTE